MKTIKDIYEWSKITHENIQDFYENVKNNTNYLENLHRGCAMMAHLHFLSNNDFKELPNRFEELGLYKPKDYYHFMEALVNLNIFGIHMVDETIFIVAKSYYEQFNRIKA